MAKVISTDTAARLWGVSSRTVVRWCEAGRIAGAEQLIGAYGVPFNNRWTIPADAKKPVVKLGRPRFKP